MIIVAFACGIIVGLTAAVVALLVEANLAPAERPIARIRAYNASKPVLGHRVAAEVQTTPTDDVAAFLDGLPQEPATYSLADDTD